MILNWGQLCCYQLLFLGSLFWLGDCIYAAPGLDSKQNPSLSKSNLRMPDDENSALRRAISQGDAELVSGLLEKKSDPNRLFEDESTPLSRAIQRDHLEIVGLLLSFKANPSYQSEDQKAPLFQAIRKGNFEISQLLLENKVDPNDPFEDKSIPLYRAMQEGNLKIVRLLLTYRADPNQVSYPRRYSGNLSEVFLLNHAIQSYDIDSGFPKMVQLLLEFQADPNYPVTTESPFSPLNRAIRPASNLNLGGENGGNLEIIKLLLQFRADLNLQDCRGLTPFLRAIDDGSRVLIKLFLDNRADPNYQTREGLTPLSVAVCDSDRDIEIIQLLLESKANPNQMNSGKNRSLLAVATEEAVEEGRSRLMKLLLAHQADPNYRVKGGILPIVQAAESCNLEITQLFLESGANPNQVFGGDRVFRRGEDTLLVRSIGMRQFKRTQFLLQHGADPNYQVGEAILPLAEALDSGKLEFIRLLLENKANPNQVKRDGRSLLVNAIYEWGTSYVQLLLEHRADPNYQPGKVRTPLAAARGNAEVTRLLLENNADPDLRCSDFD